MKSIFKYIIDIYSTLKEHNDNKDYIKFKNIYFNSYAHGIAVVTALGSVAWIFKDIFLLHVSSIFLECIIRLSPAAVLPFFFILRKRKAYKWVLTLITVLTSIMSAIIWCSVLGNCSPSGLTGEGWLVFYALLFGVSLIATNQYIIVVCEILYTLTIIITAKEFGGPICYSIPILRIVTTGFILCVGLRITSVFIRIAFTKLYDREVNIKESNKKIKELSMRDALSGLYNRYVLPEILKDDKLPYRATILMLDIDKFKLINDTYTHSGGDEAITFTAQVLKSVCDEKDYVIRYGGDEFLIICHRDDLNIEKFFINLTDIISSPLNKYNVTYSIGVSTCEANEDLYASIKKADSAAYVSKSAGRNRYTIFEDIAELNNLSI